MAWKPDTVRVQIPRASVEVFSKYANFLGTKMSDFIEASVASYILQSPLMYPGDKEYLYSVVKRVVEAPVE